jgi:hypothetical protein
MKELRSPENISLSDMCPHCGRRIWYKEEKKRSKRVYYAPTWLRQLFKKKIGNSPLGPYYLYRCEVCGKVMAVFSNNRGVLRGEVIVLYACTLTDTHMENTDGYSCELTRTCYSCPLKNGELYVKRF